MFGQTRRSNQHPLLNPHEHKTADIWRACGTRYGTIRLRTAQQRAHTHAQTKNDQLAAKATGAAVQLITHAWRAADPATFVCKR